MSRPFLELPPAFLCAIIQFLSFAYAPAWTRQPWFLLFWLSGLDGDRFTTVVLTTAFVDNDFSPRPCSKTSATTFCTSMIGAPTVVLSPSEIKNVCNVDFWPTSASSFRLSRMSCCTLYCFPPVGLLQTWFTFASFRQFPFWRVFYVGYILSWFRAYKRFIYPMSKKLLVGYCIVSKAFLSTVDLVGKVHLLSLFTEITGSLI